MNRPGVWCQVSAATGDGPEALAPAARPLAPDTRNPTPMISLSNLEKSFPQADGRLYVLRRISLDIAAGDFVTIMGPSGAGKSTLLAVVGMLDGDWTGGDRPLDNARPKPKPQGRIPLGQQDVGVVFH